MQAPEFTHGVFDRISSLGVASTSFLYTIVLVVICPVGYGKGGSRNHYGNWLSEERFWEPIPIYWSQMAIKYPPGGQDYGR